VILSWVESHVRGWYDDVNVNSIRNLVKKPVRWILRLI